MSDAILRERVPLHTIGGIDRYVENHIEPGGFLRAVLENNLKEALGRADGTNREALFVRYRRLHLQRMPVPMLGKPRESRILAWRNKASASTGAAMSTDNGTPPEKPKRQRKPKAPVAITIPAPTKKPWELSEAEVELVRNHIAKGASNEELQFCLGVARRYKLDPFRGQIWFVKRADRSLDRRDPVNKGKWIKGYKWIPIVGINGLLHIAARDHKKHFGSIGRPEYGPMIEVEWSKWDEATHRFTLAGKIKVPEWARVEVFKRGDPVATVGEVFWEEIYPNVDSAPLVRQMPRLMLGKCAKAQGVRAAYPATDGLYIQEEFMVEQAEPSENGKLSLSKVAAIDAKIAEFKQLSGGKPPTEEQCSLLEQGQSPEQVLLQASLDGAKPRAKEQPPENQEAPAPEEMLWPRKGLHSTAREPGVEG